MSLEMKYHLSKDDIVIKKEKEGSYHFLFPILPEFLPSDVAVDGGFGRDDSVYDIDFFVNIVRDTFFENKIYNHYLDLDPNMEFFDNGFLKNLYLKNDCGVVFSVHKPKSCLYTDSNFSMSEEKVNQFFKNIQYIGDIVIGEVSVFETKNVSDYKTACFLCDYLCMLHNTIVFRMFTEGFNP